MLERLVGFDTVSAKSNLALVDYVQSYLAERGFHVTRIEDPEAPKAGLFAEIGPAGEGLLLSAHTDVVPVEGQVWASDPFRLRVDGGRAYGRGTTDMKGFLAAMLAAADAASRAPLRAPLKLVLSYDEEVGCVGISRMMDRLVPLIGRPRAAIVGEPTEMRVAIGHKGKRAYHAAVGGEAGHSAMAPNFVNALNVAADFVRALQEIAADLSTRGAKDPAYDIPCSTLHVGTLQGGRALNIVPDLAEMTFELRHVARDDPDALEARIAAAAERICARYGPGARIETTRTSAYPGLETDGREPIVKEVTSLAQTATTKVAFGTEAGFFANLGIPTVVCGPGSMAGQGHKADEYLALSELRACEAMLGRVIETMCD